MKRYVYLIFLLQFLLITSAHARCNLELFRFDSSYEKIQNQLGDIPIISVSTPDRLFVPGEMVCKSEKIFEGSPVFFIFLKNKLVRMEVTRYNFGEGKPSLISWAESIYGEIEKKPKSFYDVRPYASWYWDNTNSLVRYAVESDESGFAESVVIESKRHGKLFEEQAIKEEANSN
jgi:hypothetical protein